MKYSAKEPCTSPRPFQLKNTIQHYAWGNSGDQAFIAHLLGIDPEHDTPFAELWMGVHPKAPSTIIDPNSGPQALSDWISEAPEEHLDLKFSGSDQANLPYLLKVLSANQALSIQAHPDKAQAELLNRNDSIHYPDDNHKPEIAIAIDHLDALVGFISQASFQKLLSEMPELQKLLQRDENQIDSLQASILYLLNLSRHQSKVITSTIEALQNRLTQKDDLDEAEVLFLNLSKQYGTMDVGLIFLFFLKRVHLGPGEAIFLPPGIPHAYLKGNIIECMANSDNVVRLGLTEKFCDTQALAEILRFEEHQDFKVNTSSDGYLTEYMTPTNEFTVKSLALMQGESRAFTLKDSLTMFLLLEGEISLRWDTGTSSCTCVYRRGNSFVAPANLMDFSIQAKNHSKLFLVDIPRDLPQPT